MKARVSRSLKRLVMLRPVVMVWRLPAWILATPWGLWLAVRENVRIDGDDIWYCVKAWFSVLGKPAFWLGYRSDFEYRQAKKHNDKLSERREVQNG